ncbi:MAG TPA: PhoPQ-activated pathogenicity-like protein PqaA type, partial [Candidatus Dormibacteraeota bacterium]|nr:PhoPQ-activated pathogenicity-like protein PqaA type [Candidatus Dormibacteraeota bacterium]
DSTDRDFRDDSWVNRVIQNGGRHASARISTPKHGYRAYLVEIVLKSPTGYQYKLSTEARVTPDFFPR